MTRDELIAALQAIPENLPVLIGRGEWGPCIIKEQPRKATVDMKDDGMQCWECYTVDEPAYDGEQRTDVIII